jgi:PHD/YefM family antitoxin component YafN of YafNO toxin-antitoxin module
MTYHVTAEYAKQHFEEILSRSSTEADGVVIVQENKSYVLIEQDELEALIETTELLQLPDLLADIEAAREEYRKGETLTLEQVFGE